MGLTNFPKGVTSFGIPQISGGRFSSPWATHYFVDGDNGSDGNTGLEPSQAFKTIQYAVTNSIGGDVIYIRAKSYTINTGFARYTEDVTVTLGGDGGTGKTATNARKSIIGVTSNVAPSDFGGVRWKFLTATNLTVNAPALHVESIGFFSESATYGILLQNNGATLTTMGSNGFSLYNCALKGKGLYILSGGDGVTIDHCRFQSAFDGTVAQLNASALANPGRRLAVRDCEWMGGNGTAPSAPCIVGAGPWTETVIRDCYFPEDPSGSIYINFTGANTGAVSNCHFACADVSTGRIVEGGLICTGIYDGGGLSTAT